VLHGNTVEVGRTKWLVLETVSYIDAHGVERVWDRCVRTGADGTASKVDAVVIIAILSGGDVGQAPELLLCRQFRPPLDAYTVELPAGLIDTGESPMQAAVRELREETGYIAKADESSISPVLAMSAGLTNESVYVVTVTVDMDLPANKDTNRKQELEETESIDVIRYACLTLSACLRLHPHCVVLWPHSECWCRGRSCPCSELLSRLKQMEAAGDMPFCGLWTLAAGMGLGQPASD
jgi:ADP-ribose pyrophosphatase